MSRKPKATDRTRPRAAAILALAAAAALAGCDALRGLVGAGTPEAGVAEAPPRVEVLVVEPAEFTDSVETTGTVEVPEDVTLSAEAAGTIVELVPEGREVEPGTVVAEVDAGLARAGVSRAESALEQVEEELRQAQEVRRRQAPLVRDSIISALEFSRIETRLETATAAVEQAEARLLEARERLERFRLRAPFGGSMETHFVEVGEQVTPGQAVVRLIGDPRVEVTAGIPEVYAGDIERGAPARVDLDAYGLPSRAATVGFVGRSVDPRSRTFPVRVDLPNPGGRIKAGMIVGLSVVRRVIPDALAVPLTSVLRDERGESVYLVVAEEEGDSIGVVERRAVTLGPRNSRGTVVGSGLEPRSAVIVIGLEAVAPGDTVRVAARHRGLAEATSALADTPDAGS